MKKVLALILTMALLATLGVALASEEGPRKISIGLALNANVEDYDTNEFTLYFENSRNIEIEFVLFENLGEKLPVVVASGSKLPDVILATISSTAVWNYATQGAFIPLTEYWNDPEKTATMDKRLGELMDDPDGLKKTIMSYITMPDGEIYTIPCYNSSLWNAMSYRAWINQEWLDKLNLEVPTTTDELRDVLEHFVNDDPNGNGKADEAGIVTMANGYGSHPLVYELNAFIHVNPSNNYINVENGTIVPAFTQDAFKEGLEYCYSLYKDGLIAPESFTQDQTQLRAMINVDEAVAGIVVCGSFSNFTTDKTKSWYKNSLMMPVVGPEGVCYAATSASVPENVAFITRDAQDPDFCWDILESMFDFNTHMQLRYGSEGETWTMDPEICDKYLGLYENTLGLKTDVAVINNLWGQPNNTIWNMASYPYISLPPLPGTHGLSFSLDLKTDANRNVPTSEEIHFMKYSECMPDEVFGGLVYNEQELNDLATVKPTIDSYVTESMTAFATGNRSLDEWDDYLSELETMGLETYISILQGAYDRVH